MDSEEPEPAKKPEIKNLDVMSVEALGNYIAELEAEVARARDAIAHKEAARAGAESVFKK